MANEFISNIRFEMKKILFLHGFFASGSCPMAMALQEAFDGQAIVITPDLPLHPQEALRYIRTLIDKEKPDLLLGNSCGSFLAQMLAPVVGIPALLGNPHFKMTGFLKERIGEHEYKAPRKDGNHRLVIDEALIEELAELEVELRKEDKEHSEEEFGDFLFSLINAGRLYKLNPDTCLEKTNKKFISRFNYIEAHSIKLGKPLKDMTLGEMDALWNEAKAQEKK